MVVILLYGQSLTMGMVDPTKDLETTQTLQLRNCLIPSNVTPLMTPDPYIQVKPDPRVEAAFPNLRS